MARRRYVLALDARNPLLWVDRYLSNDSVEGRTSGLKMARLRGEATMALPLAVNDTIRERIAEQAALTARLNSTNLFAAGAWAVDTAGVLESGVVPQRFRELIASSGGVTYQTILCADREGATTALAAARSRSLAEIGAMAPEPQAEAVRAMWRNFAAYFEALGVLVLGWARFRNAVAAATLSDAGNDGLQGFLVSDQSGGFPRGYDLLFGRRPSGGPATADAVANAVAALSAPPPAIPWPDAILTELRSQGTPVTPTSDSNVARSLVRSADVQMIYRSVRPQRKPSWVEEAAARYRAIYGFDPAQVWFGSKAEVEATGHSVLRLYINDAGRVAGSTQDPNVFDRYDCVLRNGRTGAADGTTGGLPAPAAGFNWMCGAISRDPQNREYYLGPLLWYAQLLQPLLDYLATRDPLEVAYEIQLDVLGKNLWTVIATGRSESALAGFGVRQAMAGQAAADAGFRANMADFNVAASTILVGLTALNPIAGAIGGLGVAGVNLFAEFTRAPPVFPRLDTFDRVEPVIERFQIAAGNSRAYQCGDVGNASALDMRYHGDDSRYVAGAFSVSGPARSLATSLGYGAAAVDYVGGVTDGASTMTTVGRPTLRTIGMVPYWTIYFDGAAAPNGRWDGDTWVVDAPAGYHTLRILPPPGVDAAPRSMGVYFASLGPSEVEFTAVPQEPVASPIVPGPGPGSSAIVQPPTSSTGFAKVAVGLGLAALVGAGAVAYAKRNDIRRAFRKGNASKRRRRA